MHTTEIEPYTMSESPFMKDWKQLQAQSTQSEVETVQALAARLANLSAEMEAHGQDPLGFYQSKQWNKNESKEFLKVRIASCSKFWTS